MKLPLSELVLRTSRKSEKNTSFVEESTLRKIQKLNDPIEIAIKLSLLSRHIPVNNQKARQYFTLAIYICLNEAKTYYEQTELLFLFGRDVELQIEEHLEEHLKKHQEAVNSNPLLKYLASQLLPNTSRSLAAPPSFEEMSLEKEQEYRKTVIKICKALEKENQALADYFLGLAVDIAIEYQNYVPKLNLSDFKKLLFKEPGEDEKFLDEYLALRKSKESATALLAALPKVKIDNTSLALGKRPLELRKTLFKIHKKNTPEESIKSSFTRIVVGQPKLIHDIIKDPELVKMLPWIDKTQSVKQKGLLPWAKKMSSNNQTVTEPQNEADAKAAWGKIHKAASSTPTFKSLKEQTFRKKLARATREAIRIKKRHQLSIFSKAVKFVFDVIANISEVEKNTLQKNNYPLALVKALKKEETINKAVKDFQTVSAQHYIHYAKLRKEAQSQRSSDSNLLSSHAVKKLIAISTQQKPNKSEHTTVHSSSNEAKKEISPEQKQHHQNLESFGRLLSFSSSPPVNTSSLCDLSLLSKKQSKPLPKQKNKGQLRRAKSFTF